MNATRRRLLLALAMAGPSAFAQRASMRRIGVVTGASESFFAAQRAVFENALVHNGWKVGENLLIAYRYGLSSDGLAQATVSELHAAGIEALVVMGGFEDRELPRLSRSMPVIALFGADPVAQGYIASYAHPGGNLTGLASFGEPELPKLLETAQSAFLNLKRLGVLHPGASDEAEERRLSALAGRLGIDMVFAGASNEAGVLPALESLKKRQATAVLVLLDPAWSIPRIGDALTRTRLPSIADVESFAEGGGLIAYGPGANVGEVMRRFAHFVDRILRGARPRDLPVESLPNARLVLNLRTARALAYEFPRGLLLRADRVIE